MPWCPGIEPWLPLQRRCLLVQMVAAHPDVPQGRVYGWQAHLTAACLGSSVTSLTPALWTSPQQQHQPSHSFVPEVGDQPELRTASPQSSTLGSMTSQSRTLEALLAPSGAACMPAPVSAGASSAAVHPHTAAGLRQQPQHGIKPAGSRGRDKDADTDSLNGGQHNGSAYDHRPGGSSTVDATAEQLAGLLRGQHAGGCAGRPLQQGVGSSLKAMLLQHRQRRGELVQASVQASRSLGCSERRSWYSAVRILAISRSDQASRCSNLAHTRPD